MLNIVELECSCGTVKGKLKVVSGAFFHVHCLCKDCQKFASHLNNEEHILDKHGATELLQTYPNYMEITTGQHKISCVQLYPKGLYRWHTSCCNMPLANTMKSSKIPFVGVPVTLMKFSSPQEKLATLGPVTLKAFGQYSKGEMPKDAHPRFPLNYMPKILFFMLKGLLTGKYKKNPFFNAKEPITKVNVLP